MVRMESDDHNVAILYGYGKIEEGQWRQSQSVVRNIVRVVIIESSHRGRSDHVNRKNVSTDERSTKIALFPIYEQAIVAGTARASSKTQEDGMRVLVAIRCWCCNSKAGQWQIVKPLDGHVLPSIVRISLLRDHSWPRSELLNRHCHFTSDIVPSCW